jgi:ubiquinone/menaquinone biosynthesis C-methylase UbiE
MTTFNDSQQRDLVRDRFTRTAEVFGNFAVADRAREAELLASLVAAAPADLAIDLACGPGTLALRFARHVRWICGLDLTPAILSRARDAARADGIANMAFALGDAQSLPFPDRSLDVAVTSYSLHHMPHPERTIAEMARVLRCGGRIGVIDIFAPEDSAAAEINNRIERFRDPSHTRTLARSEFDKIFAAQGLRILSTQIEPHPRSFDHWLKVAGWSRGDSAYIEARRLMETTIPDDVAGFHPQFAALDPGKPAEAPDINMVNTSLYIAAEKIR